MLTVAVRFRPESYFHTSSEDENIPKHYPTNDAEDTQRSIEVFEKPQNYVRINNDFNLYFNTVLGFNSFQSDVFSKVIRCKVNDFLNGKNCCILTYGAKSSGKSYSMFGKLSDKNAVSHLGILPRSISYIIEKLQSECKANIDWNLFISFGVVYNDKISDLIDCENSKHIHIKKNKKTNEYYLKNLTQIKIKKISSFLKNMHLSEQNRNKLHSQYEHHTFAVIKLNMYKQDQMNHYIKISSTILNFIDCAGYPSSDAVDYQQLNFSFIQLNALMTRISKENDLSIDIRESVLTKLLYPIRQQTQPVTEGKLLILINCTLDPLQREETIATLRFGNLPTIDPFILGMLEKQRHKIKKLETKGKEYKHKYKELKGANKEKEKENQKDGLKVIIAGFETENGELTKNLMEIENKYELLKSEHELLQLDYVSNKKELNTQKNHNFWLMEDYNELKLKLKRSNSQDHLNDGDKMGHLLKEIRRLREENRENEEVICVSTKKMNEYEVELNEYESELNELMMIGKEREEEMHDLRKELSQFASDKDIYEKYIKELHEANIFKKGTQKQQEGEEGDKDAAIRALKMQIIGYKTDINSSEIVEKLKNKKRKLEEKVINLRTDKAKQIVIHNQEMHQMSQEVNALHTQMNNMVVIRKWSNLMHKGQLMDVSKNIERANKKMKENYTQNSEFRDQMFLLRKIAEKKLDHAMRHKLNGINAEKDGDMELTPYKSVERVNYEEIAIETTGDFEAEMVGLLPTNLKRIHHVIDQLTHKLMIKNNQIHELRLRYHALNRKYDSDYDSSKETDEYHVIHDDDEEQQILDDIFNELPSISTKMMNAYSSNDSKNNVMYDDDEEDEDEDEDVDTDTKIEENYLNKQYNKTDEYQEKQKQLRLLQEALSIAFHIDNAKNSRIKLNVSMSPYDVYKEMCFDKKPKHFTLIVRHSQDVERIVIPSNCVHMSFWELIIEFGIFNLLHFNICCDESAETYYNNNNNVEDEDEEEINGTMHSYNPKIKYKKSRKRKDSKRGSGLWNMFAKKSVS